MSLHGTVFRHSFIFICTHGFAVGTVCNSLKWDI